MILVDASVGIDYLNGLPTPEADCLDTFLETERLGMTDLTLCEVLQGVKGRDEAVRVQEYLLEFEIFATGGIGLALAAAANYRFLRERGVTIRKTIDCWVASFCLREGHALLQRDRDFDGFEQLFGLKIVHPA